MLCFKRLRRNFPHDSCQQSIDPLISDYFMLHQICNLLALVLKTNTLEAKERRRAKGDEKKKEKEKGEKQLGRLFTKWQYLHNALL